MMSSVNQLYRAWYVLKPQLNCQWQVLLIQRADSTLDHFISKSGSNSVSSLVCGLFGKRCPSLSLFMNLISAAQHFSLTHQAATDELRCCIKCILYQWFFAYLMKYKQIKLIYYSHVKSYHLDTSFKGTAVFELTYSQRCRDQSLAWVY